MTRDQLIYCKVKLMIERQGFLCTESIAPLLATVFEGEYDVPYDTEWPPVILDIGANFGAFSLWAVHRWPGCEIHAYEPQEAVFGAFNKNLRWYDNIYANNYAIGTPGLRPLYDGPSNTGETSLHLQEGQKSATGRHIEVRDPLTLPGANILKMDTEGCEVEILEPLIRAGREFDAVMFEYHREGDRSKLDDLLCRDYALTGAHVYNPDRGVLRYVRKELL